jgi:hypothetical protein
MTTVYTTNPIKINIMSIRENRILRKYVFIGIVPKAVEKDLIKIQTAMRFSESRNLANFYGEHWPTKVGVDFLASDKKSGGDDSDEFDADFSFDEEIPAKGKSALTEDDLTALDNSAPNFDPIFAEIEEVATLKPASEGTQLHFIFDDPQVSVYPFDKISEFKQKISVVSKIPIYRQHVWISTKTMSMPLSYNVSVGGSFVPVNIQSISGMYTNGKLAENAKQIENIPVNTDLYNANVRIRVEAHDSFKIMEEYHTKYDATEFNVADLDEFIPLSNKALLGSISTKQHIDLIYYGFVIVYWPMLTLPAFRDYLKGESGIQTFYPELCPDLTALKKMYASEKEIMDISLDLQSPSKKQALDMVESNISNSITSAIITVSYVSNMKEKFIFVRNLFDSLELSDRMDACRCFAQNNDKSFILDKVYKNAEIIKEPLATPALAVRITPADDNLFPIVVIFYQNGNYVIKSSWRDEANYGFDSIFKEIKTHVDPLIALINKNAAVLYEGKKVPSMSKNNTKFVEIGTNVYYKRTFTESQFAFLKFILEEFRAAGIIDSRTIEKNYAEYYFRKGMYQFDPRRIEKVSNITNYYEHMSDGGIKQKWFTIFEKTRIMKIWHRFSDIKVEIYGIKEKEFNTFFTAVKTMFHMYESRKRDTVEDYEFKKILKKKVKKSLTNLKEQDPVLYDFKKMYKSDKVYSRICQKSYQPLIINKTAYDSMPEDQKAKVVKYWNFTTETDAYYQCPNPKYPYIKFITKNHPKDYCIPCCKKMDVAPVANDPKKIIHDICLRDHEYNKERKTITVGSKYIMAYGKDIEVGRLSKLPEDSMESIFYETFSMEHGADQSYMTSDGFYLYGTAQHTASISDVGYVYSLAHALELNLGQLVDILIERLHKNPGGFSILLKGQITQYVSDYKELIQHLLAFKDESPDFFADSHEVIPWNKLFIDLAFNYLNINTILFQHESIDLRLPNGLEDVSDYIVQSKKNIIILQKGRKYYPIYLINTDLFFKLGIIEKRLFLSVDGIVRIIANIVKTYIKTVQIKGKTHSKITLSIIKEFLTQESMRVKYVIHKLFINHSNFCYGVQFYIKSKDKYVYVPIDQSYYSFENIALEFGAYSRREHVQTFTDLMIFIDDFNKWVDVQSVRAQVKNIQDIYPIIRIETWLVFQKGLDFQDSDKVIGFRSANLNYYFSDMSHSEAIKARRVKSVPVFYDPDEINAIIHSKSDAKPDRRSQNMPRILYKYNAYHLFLLEFLKVFSAQQNTIVRTQLKKALLGDFIKNMGAINKKISSVVADREDLIKIRMQLSDYINNHHDRKQLFLDIDNSTYNFDKIIMTRLMSMSIGPLKKELTKMSKSFVKIGEIPPQIEFPNMFSACNETSMGYCKGNALILSKEKYETFIDIFANDILNPIKQKWIFSDIMSDRVIDFLKFVYRPHEEIHVALADELS